MTKIKMCCPECRSEKIACEAFAVWNVDTQEWEMASTHEQVWCSECGYEGDRIEKIETVGESK